MTVVSTSIPNLVNGISQQNPTQRNITQAEAQVNAQSSIVKGLSKRPPLEFVANISSNQDGTKSMQSIKPKLGPGLGKNKDSNRGIIFPQLKTIL